MANNENNTGLQGGEIPSRGTILCIFQDPTLVLSIEPAIARNGFTLLRARTAMHGLWMATTAKPNVILTDIPEATNESDPMLDSLAKNRLSRDVPVVAFVDSMQQPGVGLTCLRNVAHVMLKKSSIETILNSVIKLVDDSPVDALATEDAGSNRNLRIDAAFSDFASEPTTGSKFRATYRQRAERRESTQATTTVSNAPVDQVAPIGTLRMMHGAHENDGLPISSSIEERLARYAQREAEAVCKKR